MQDRDSLKSNMPVHGKVKINGIEVGQTNTPFVYAFQGPTNGIVSAIGYPDTPVSFDVKIRKISTQVYPNIIARNRLTQVTVQAIDADSHQQLSGSVKINGVVVGQTNTAFNYTFQDSTTSGMVCVSGYPDRVVTFNVQEPSLLVRAEPHAIPLKQSIQLTIFAEDSIDHFPVEGQVLVSSTLENLDNGSQNVEVGRTNTPFNYTFIASPVFGRGTDRPTFPRPIDAIVVRPPWVVRSWLYPVITVKASGYKDARVPIQFPVLPVGN